MKTRTDKEPMCCIDKAYNKELHVNFRTGCPIPCPGSKIQVLLIFVKFYPSPMWHMGWVLVKTTLANGKWMLWEMLEVPTKFLHGQIIPELFSPNSWYLFLG